ncbi:glycerol-3-phosphate dehydrogenase/oxidase [Castellaniella sp. GW247-6E4]|uniref:glycerol-3-phosphate dehydrogenase/oxidase n=1 Tax=Castellaniella sp. GW247-6E4 TaxID=3140380 RepID=UPI0033147F96
MDKATALSARPLDTDRTRLIAGLEATHDVDIVIIGGGATGLGIALDASLRGLSVVLLESHDFAGGTSSRATKLVHGGVRYLAQGNLALVREALHERCALLHNAPHLAQALAFVVPGYQAWKVPFYGLGLKVYDALSGSDSLGPTRWLGRANTLASLPGVRPQGLWGGVRYWDGQFDDARLALALARTAAAQGAQLLNYCPVVGLLHEGGRIGGVQWRDAAGAAQGTVRSRCVVNATGVWVDQVRHLGAQGSGAQVRSLVEPSQGVHVVVDRGFMPGDQALLVPRTSDGRVLFAVPWLGRLILGTTDTPREDLPRDPLPFQHEIDFILSEAARVLARAPTRDDIRSLWVGLRPLVRPLEADGEPTQSISREHTVEISPAGLVTVTGGKWTTYRAMAEDVLARCVQAAFFDRLPPCRTADFRLLGAVEPPHVSLHLEPGPHLYGAEAPFLAELPGADAMLGLGLSEAMVRFAVRHEYARTVEDVLARRHRMLFLDAALAYAAAPRVAQILEEETGIAQQPTALRELAIQYGARDVAVP